MDVYRKTLLMLDACNLSGLVRSFSREILPAVWEEVRAQGGGTDQVNRHPLSVLWTMKMMNLAVAECLCSQCVEAFGKAYRAVIARVEGTTTEGRT